MVIFILIKFYIYIGAKMSKKKSHLALKLYDSNSYSSLISYPSHTHAYFLNPSSD